MSHYHDRPAPPRPRWDRTTSSRPQVRAGTDEHGQPWVWLCVPVDDAWVAEHRLAVQAGRVVVAEVRVYPSRWAQRAAGAPESGEHRGLLADDVPPKGLSTRLLRRLTIGAHIDEMSHILELAELAGTDLLPAPLRDAQIGTAPGTNLAEVARRLARRPGLVAHVAERQARPERRRGGRQPLPEVVIAEAAAAYIDARRRGSQHPIPDTARKLKTSVARLRDLVYRARRRGFLTPTVQGRGGGTLTSEAQALLRAARRRTQRRLRR
jgi:hypothetical protein